VLDGIARPYTIAGVCQKADRQSFGCLLAPGEEFSLCAPKAEIPYSLERVLLPEASNEIVAQMLRHGKVPPERAVQATLVAHNAAPPRAFVNRHQVSGRIDFE